MDKIKVINEVLNHKLCELVSVNSVYDGCFQSEIEPNVPLMAQKLMQLFLKTFQTKTYLV